MATPPPPPAKDRDTIFNQFLVAPDMNGETHFFDGGISDVTARQMQILLIVSDLFSMGWFPVCFGYAQKGNGRLIQLPDDTSELSTKWIVKTVSRQPIGHKNNRHHGARRKRQGIGSLVVRTCQRSLCSLLCSSQ